MNLKEEIRKNCKGEVFNDEKILHIYENDASLFEVTPEIVVYPKNKEDIQSLVSFVNKHKKDIPKLSITARGAGTGMSGGSLNESIIVDVTKHINHIGKIENQSIVVEPGVFYRDMEKKTLENNLEKTLNYGCTKDYVQKLKVILSDGNEYEFGPLTKDELELKMTQQNFEGEIYRKIFELVENNVEKIKNARPNVSKNSTGYSIWDVNF